MSVGDVFYWDMDTNFYLVLKEHKKKDNNLKSVMIFSDKNLSLFYRYGVINEDFINKNMKKFRSLSDIEVKAIKKEFADYLEFM